MNADMGTRWNPIQANADRLLESQAVIRVYQPLSAFISGSPTYFFLRSVEVMLL